VLLVLQKLDPEKYPLPEPYPYKEAAKFFKEPEVTPADQLPPLKWTAPDEDGLVAYLVGEGWLGGLLLAGLLAATARGCSLQSAQDAAAWFQLTQGCYFCVCCVVRRV
jgi:hypothetical protein